MYPTAENYNPVASRDDGSCIFVGCTNAAYASFSPQANAMDNTLCTNVPVSADLNADGTVQIEDLMQFLQAFAAVTPQWSGLGWVASACNVDALNTDEMLASLVSGLSAGPSNPTCGLPGCGYPGALNYDADAGMDFGLCVFGGCTDEEALNYDRLATVDDNSCRYDVCPDFNEDGQVKIGDLMDFLLLWGN